MTNDIVWQHIIPINDSIDHDANSFQCQCNPDIDFENNIVVHSSLDQREFFE